MKRKPTLTLVKATKAAMYYTLKMPDRPGVRGGSYHVTTYPDSELIFVQTFVRRRKCRAAKIIAAAQAAVLELKS